MWGRVHTGFILSHRKLDGERNKAQFNFSTFTQRAALVLSDSNSSRLLSHCPRSLCTYSMFIYVTLCVSVSTLVSVSCLFVVR